MNNQLTQQFLEIIRQSVGDRYLATCIAFLNNETEKSVNSIIQQFNNCTTDLFCHCTIQQLNNCATEQLSYFATK